MPTVPDGPTTRRLAVGLVFLLLGTAGLRAQHATFGPLAPGQAVRVKTIGHSLFETRLGRVQNASPAELFAHADIPFDAERVDSLWVRGRATRTGAIVGAAIFTPLSFLVSGGLCEGLSYGAGCDAWGTVALLTLAGGVGGALAGAGIGSLIPKWRLRFARGDAVSVAPFLAPGGAGIAVRF